MRVAPHLWRLPSPLKRLSPQYSITSMYLDSSPPFFRATLSAHLFVNPRISKSISERRSYVVWSSSFGKKNQNFVFKAQSFIHYSGFLSSNLFSVGDDQLLVQSFHVFLRASDGGYGTERMILFWVWPPYS